MKAEPNISCGFTFVIASKPSFAQFRIQCQGCIYVPQTVGLVSKVCGAGKVVPFYFHFLFQTLHINNHLARYALNAFILVDLHVLCTMLLWDFEQNSI